jgi:hypothetical protein
MSMSAKRAHGKRKSFHTRIQTHTHTHTHIHAEVDECREGPWAEKNLFNLKRGFMVPLCTNCTFEDDLEYVNPLYKTFIGEQKLRVCMHKIPNNTALN